ncbi:MAG: MMPL family transporter [Bacteroidales bacterium]|nr:MMPL family transporter [Bacteroidales bacterium]
MIRIMERLFIGLHHLILKFKWIFIALLVILIAVTGFYASRLQLSEDVSKLLPEKDMPTNLIENLEAIDFADRIFFHLELSDSTEVNPEILLQAADSLIANLQKDDSGLIADIQYKVSPSSIDQVYNFIINYLPYYLEEGDYSVIEKMIQKKVLETNFRKKYKSLFSPAAMFMRKMIAQDPVGLSIEPLKRLQTFQFDSNFELYKDAIFTSDKKHLIFYLKPTYKSSDSKNNGRLIESIERKVEKIERDKDYILSIQYFGAPAVAYANAKQIKRDVILTVVIAVFAIVLLVAFFYRRKRLFVIIFIPAALAVLTAMAILYLLKGEVSAIALGMGSILVGISIDYVLHIFTHSQNGHSVTDILKDVTSPILISSLTTAAAFFGLLSISSGALRDMGLFAGISILFAALFSLIIIPLFLPETEGLPIENNSLKDKLKPLFNFPFHKKRWLIISILLITPFFYYFSGKVQFEGDLNAINYMSEKLKTAEAKLNSISSVSQRNVFLISRATSLDSALYNAEKIQQVLDGFVEDDGIDLKHTRIQYLLPSEGLQKKRLERWQHFWTAERIQTLKKNLDVIRQQYGFKPNTFNDFVESLNRKYFPITEKDKNFIRKHYLNELIKENESGYTVLTQIKVSNKQKIQLHDALRKSEFSNTVMDKEYLATRFMDALRADFNLLVIVSMLLVFLIILIAFGRIELALITYLPMIISWIWTLGIMAIFGLSFNIVNIVISTLIFGLGIDYSIFITRGLMKEYSDGKNVLLSFKTSIFFSSLTTILGIGVLIFAEHPALKSMALVTVVGLFSVLLNAFTIQPWLFSFLVNTKGKKRVLPMTLGNIFGSIIAFIFFLLGTIVSTISGFILLKLIPGRRENLRLLFHRILQFSSKAMVYVMFYVPKKVIGYDKEKFDKPAVIISNHQSHIDIVLLLMLYPKMILLTNDWVQRNPFYGVLVRMAHFYPVLDRLEDNLPLIKRKVEQGYSVMVFPEGSRSENSKIRRFHKGAFYIAEKLQLDILPVLLHGVGDCITKGENFLKSGHITVKILDRIKINDSNFTQNYAQRSKEFRQFYIREFDILKQKQESPKYFRTKLINNYIYKGPVLEWYARIKTRFDNNYELFDKLIPRDAKIIDLGCGYGFMDYMLYFLSEKRQIIGVDYDEDKIRIAQNVHESTYSTEDQIRFEVGDVSTFVFEEADVFVLSDVLHYLPFEEQDLLLDRCISKLNAGGRIIIRDADSQHKKHKGTRFSEWQSTKLIGFNKTATTDKQLFFTSKKRLEAFFISRNYNFEVIDKTRLNSNLIYIARKA